MRPRLRSITRLSRPLQSRPLQLCLQLSLAGGLLWLWGHSLNWTGIVRLIQPQRIGWLPVVVGFALAGSLLRAWRWQLVVGSRSRLGLIRAFLINEGANLVNVLIPIRAGDLLRMFWLRRWCRLPAGGGAGMVMADHALELGAATLLLCGAAIAYLVTHGVGPASLWLAGDAGGAIVLLTLLLATIVFAPRIARSGTVRQVSPSRFSAWLIEHGRHFEGSGLFGLSPGRASVGGGLTFAAFGADALMLSSLFASLGMSLPVIHSVAVCLALVPGYAMPSPGGAGVVELIGTLAVQTGGHLQQTAAAAGVLAFHFSGVAITLACGMVAIAVLGLPARQSLQGSWSDRPLAAALWIRREAQMIAGEWQAKSLPELALEKLAEPPPGEGRPVMLIPGLLSSDESLAFLARWFKRWGYRTIVSGIRHNSHCPDRLIDSMAARLRADLEPGTKALLVGHSKGGLIGFGIASRYPELVKRMLALGSPLRDPFDLQWNTTVTVRLVAALNRLRRESLPGCYTKKCTCEAMRLIHADVPPPVPVTNIASPRDGIVKFESCLRPHVAIRVVDSWHNSMPRDAEVISVVASWLRQGIQAAGD